MTPGGTRILRDVVRQRVKTEGLRPFAARIGIPVGKIRSLLEGRAVLSTTMEAVASALELEFYIGPPHGFNDESQESVETVDFGKLEQLQAETRALRNEVAAEHVTWRATLQEVLARLPSSQADQEDGDALGRQVALANVFDVDEAQAVPIMELAAAAGGGAVNLDETVTGYLSFPFGWLRSLGLTPALCNVISVQGESMEPTLPEGCSILVDRSQRQLRINRIFVVRTDDGLVVKRAGKAPDGNWLLVSDHPHWKSIALPFGSDVVGEVKWMSRTL